MYKRQALTVRWICLSYQQEWSRGIFRLLAIARRRFLLGRKGEKNMKKVLKLMLALVMTCAIAGCSSSSKNDADVTITIGTSPDYAPVSYTHLDVYKRQTLSN